MNDADFAKQLADRLLATNDGVGVVRLDRYDAMGNQCGGYTRNELARVIQTALEERRRAKAVQP